MKILVTGASGFVGKAFCHEFADRINHPQSHQIFAAARSPSILADLPPSTRLIPITTLADLSLADSILNQIDCVVHLAARVHQMKDTAADPLAAFRAINTEATCDLARAAAQAGVKRFIYLSSIKVNGEQTAPGKPFTPDDLPTPTDPYAISKYEAELGLQRLAAETGMEVVIIRPPLVYGPGVKANFLTLMRSLYKGIPLPLGGIQNRRSLVALPNLVDLIITCLRHPAAANQIFLVSDNEDLSTPELLRRLAVALGTSARLIPLPASWLWLLATMVGQRALAQRLCSSLQVDIHKTQARLGWVPPISVNDALKATAHHWRSL